MKAYILKLTALLSLTTAWVAPGRMERTDFRGFFSPAKIVLDRSSPAYAALEDSRLTFAASDRTAQSADLITVNKEMLDPRKTSDSILSRTSHISLSRSLNKVMVSKVAVEEYRREEVEDLQSSDESAQKQEDTLQDKAQKLVNEELERRGTYYGARKSLYTRSPDRAPANSGQTFSKPGPIRTPNKQPVRYVLSGGVTFTKGAAFVGGAHEISIAQKSGGLIHTRGDVSASEASYQIAMDTLEGELVAEVRGNEGQVLAMGSIDLGELRKKRGAEARIRGLSIEVSPVFDGTQVRLISAASTKDVTYGIYDARLFVDALNREVIYNKSTRFYEDSDLVMPSNYLLEARKENYWPSLTFQQSGQSTPMRMFPRALVEALFNLTLSKYEAREAEEEGVIWGRVTSGGHPIEGATIRLVGQENAKPTYFTGYIPDQHRSYTSDRGEFAFTRLDEEEKMVQVSLGGKSFWPVLVPVRRGHVSYIELEIEVGRTVDFKSYDAFTGQPVLAAVTPVGTEEQIVVPESGVAQIEVNAVSGIKFMESKTVLEEYEPIRVFMGAQQGSVFIPQIKKKWLEGFLPAEPPEKSKPCVGFVSGDDYTVVIGSGGAEQPMAEVSYFDSEGKKTNRGVVGGGFVVTGLSEGLQAVTVIPDNSKRVITQTVYIDNFASHVLNVRLME